MMTGKMRMAFLAGGIIVSIFAGFKSAGYDYVQPEKPCGVKKAGSIVTLTVSVLGGKIISGDILNADALSWKKIDPSNYTCTILPADTPGAHTGTFEGQYVKNGGGSGESKPLTWFASAKTTVVTLSGSLTGTARPRGSWDNVDIVINNATGSPSGLPGGINGSFAFTPDITTDPKTPVALRSTTNVLSYTETFISSQTVIGKLISSSLTYGGVTFSAAGVFSGAGAVSASYN